ncbi:MAG: hypothetical protein ACKOA8_02880, partial [Deltaproteobacteria bacterium]
MSLFQLKTRILVVSAIFFSGLAQGALYTHTIRSLDLDQGIGGCNQYLEQAAKQFAQDAGVTIIAASCEFESLMNRINGAIAYSAPKPAPIWSTNDSTYGEQLDYYSSRQNCEKGLELEVQTVKKLT